LETAKRELLEETSIANIVIPDISFFKVEIKKTGVPHVKLFVGIIENNFIPEVTDEYK